MKITSNLKILLLVAVLILTTSITHAQTWQHNLKHNGYACSMLKTSDNITIIAAKGIAGNMGPALFIKIKVPYKWGSTSVGGTGCVKYVRKHLITGELDSQTSYFNYKDGWLYFEEYLWEWCTMNTKRGNYPCYTYTITLYENNDHGRSTGKKTVVNVNFDKLNTIQMKMNEVAFETHW